MKSPFYFCLTLFFLLFSTSLSSQNAFYDAIQLSEYVKQETAAFERVNSEEINEWTSILGKYLDTQDKLTTTKVIECFAGEEDPPYNSINPFFLDLLPDGELQSDAPVQLEDQRKSLFSKIGGLKISRFSDGLAQFLIERSKEELYVSYFHNLQEAFTRYPEFEKLMPQVHDFVALFRSYQYKEMIPVVRESFKKDLEGLPNHLIELKKLNSSSCPFEGDGDCKKRMEEYQAFFKKDGSKFFIATNIILDQLIAGANPVEMMETLNEHEDFKDLEGFKALGENFVNGMKMLEFFSDNLRYEEESGESYELKANTTTEAEEGYENEQEERLWVSKESWKKMDKTTLRIFLGLLYQQEASNEIYFRVNGEKMSLRAILGKFADTINPIEDYVRNFVNKADALDTHLQSIEAKKQAGEEFTYRDYYSYYMSVLDLLKVFFQFDEFLGNYVEDINSTERADHFLKMANLSGEIYYDLNTRHFGTVVLNTLVLLDESIADTSFKSSKFREKFFKYGTFMAALAEAEDAEVVESVLEATVLPVGSARIKRDNKSNVALNAYLGAFGGGEYLTGASRWNGSLGIFAPVGVSFSKGIVKQKSSEKTAYESGGSWSWFLSVIDIGAVTAFRMGDDSTEVLPDLRLENILAPGLHFIKGSGKSPVSYGIGIQAGPMLRRIKGQEGLDPEAIFSNKLNYRVHAFLAVDIPLINFKTEPW